MTKRGEMQFPGDGLPTKQERQERKAMARRAALDQLGLLLPEHMFQMDYDADVSLGDGDDGAWVDVRIWVRRKGRFMSSLLTLTIEQTRRRIADLSEDERCSPGCKGWDVFDTNTVRGLEIERCDECFASLPVDRIVMDDDVEQLPEAIEALRLAKENDHG